jgi:hypothetical protein
MVITLDECSLTVVFFSVLATNFLKFDFFRAVRHPADELTVSLHYYGNPSDGRTV